MSQKKMTAKRRSWASIKRAKAASEERRSGDNEAKEAFELAEHVRQTRERVGLTQAETGGANRQHPTGRGTA